MKKTLTEVLRIQLKKSGIACSDGYEWHDGEALYYGDPIMGRATPAELDAIEYTEAIQNGIIRQEK